MTYEWTKVELYGANNDGSPRRYTIADGTAVSKGTLMELTDPRTCVVITGTKAVAGVTSEEKVANDGITDIALWTDGIFEVTASGAIGVGNPVAADSLTANTVMCPASAQLASGAITCGYALETATADEKINVRLRL